MARHSAIVLYVVQTNIETVEFRDVMRGVWLSLWMSCLLIRNTAKAGPNLSHNFYGIETSKK